MSRMSKRDSIIYRTKQSWKLHASLALILVAAVAETLATLRSMAGTVSSRDVALICGLGALLALGGLFLYFGSIRCPACGARWMWRAATSSKPGSIGKVLTAVACPDCGAPDGPTHNNQLERTRS